MCDVLCPKCESCRVVVDKETYCEAVCLDCDFCGDLLEFAVHGLDNSGKPAHTQLYFDLFSVFIRAEVEA